MDAFIGEIRSFGFNFVPEGWLPCYGGRYEVHQYQALFAVIGNLYGTSDGRTFYVPDLRDMAPIGAGRVSPGIAAGGMPSEIMVGKSLGMSSVELVQPQMPSHTHQVNAVVNTNLAVNKATADSTSMLSRMTHSVSGGPSLTIPAWGQSDNPDVLMAPEAIATAGQSESHPNIQPILTLNFCICHDGTWPTRPS